MGDLLFGDNAAWFTVPAFIGTGIFVLRLALMLIGGVADMDLDLGVDHGGGDIHHGDASAHAFQILSVQGISGFLMGFGLGGLAAYKNGQGWPLSIGVGVGVGIAMVWILGVSLKGLHDMQSSGNISIDQTIGVEGDVYVGVPTRGSGRGQVRLIVNNRERMFNAISEAGDLPSRTRVRVVGINDDNSVTVQPI
ncbi:MAG: hypothetical protein H7Y88_11585 [Phycisphaerales bacterium]|nr:hypothetical protein [Phycisphaerales bacterium]